MKAIEQLRINGGLPSPKGVALAIMQISRRDDATLEEISRLVQSDPVTSGRLLHMANAASVGARPLASIPEAIIRLGLAAVRQAILWEVGFAPAACRAERVHGLVVFPLNEGGGGDQVVVGTGEWRWGDMLAMR